MLLDAAESQLVLVDYQIRLLPAIFEGAQVVANAVRLGQLARLMEVPVWGTEQSPSKRNRDAAFDRLAGAGAELVTTEMVAFEWLRTAEHPAFKSAQALIK
jgi:nicotinamidase-related amidase